MDNKDEFEFFTSDGKDVTTNEIDNIQYIKQYNDINEKVRVDNKKNNKSNDFSINKSNMEFNKQPLNQTSDNEDYHERFMNRIEADICDYDMEEKNSTIGRIALVGIALLTLVLIIIVPKKNHRDSSNDNTSNNIKQAYQSESATSKVTPNSDGVIESTASSDSVTGQQAQEPYSTPVVTTTLAPLDSTTKIESDSDTVSMIFGGDVLLSDSMVNSYNKNGGNITNIMKSELLSEFVNADIAMVNQEFPFSTRGEKMQNKQYTFRTDPRYVRIFNDLGIDIVSLANNHILDFGIEPLIDSMNTLISAQIKYVGAGNNLDEARQTKYFEVNNKKIAYISASRVIPVATWNATASRAGVFTTYDSTAIVSEITKAKQQSDFAVVYVHWGVEHKERPENFQKSLAKRYIDAGADLVIGCHTHCLQGMEYYKDKPIIYSMGNFMFGSVIDKTLVLKVSIGKEDKTDVAIIPCSSTAYCTNKILDNTKNESFLKYYTQISYGVSFDNYGNVIR